MKQAKKIAKIFLITSAVLLLGFFVCSASFYISSTRGIKLDTNSIEQTNNSPQMKIYDKDKNEIKPTDETSISIKKLSSHTTNAFVCAEDKRFYNHKGIDYIRIGGAIISNIKSKSFSEGASTISQQLIKNTQLSSEKTIKRKLKEIKLTKQLEKNYTKSQILEMYLNNIYFGNGCYGIENASKHYFDKSASQLSLAESALLAGTINAPSYYDIENKTNIAESRRNLILDLMEKHGKITTTEKENAKKEPTTLKITKLSNNNLIYGKIIEEACLVLKLTETQLKNSHFEIHTNYDTSLQKEINNSINSNYSNINKSLQICSIVIDNETNNIISITGNNQTFSSKKQPGSTIKPILVYAPAIENKNISPASKILDEKININGYSPENADKKYHGYVSVREALKNSYNIPAVKILNETGIEKSQNFAKKLGIEFNEKDNHLAIALGGFTDGITLKSICDAYTAFANNGKYSPSSYITKITKNNNLIYQSNHKKQKVMNEDTAYLITNMLIDTAKSGTAKRLKNTPFEVASKTGTVGLSNSKNNSDAFNVSYTSKHTILTYFGHCSMNEKINGSTYPTMLSKNILELLYKKQNPEPFKKPNSIVTKKINKTEYEQNIISQTDEMENYIEELFSKNNLPPQTETSLSLNLEIVNLRNKKPVLKFFANPNFTYKIIRKQNKKEEIISSLTHTKNANFMFFEDKTTQNNTIYEYFLQIINNSTNEVHQTNSIKLKTF